MQITIYSKNMEVSEDLHRHIEEKVNKIQKFLEDTAPIIEAKLEVAVERTRSRGEIHKIVLTFFLNGSILRAVETAPDPYTALDRALDWIHREALSYKEKKDKKPRGQELPQAVLPTAEAAAEEEAEEERVIVRRKRFEIKPMDDQEAIEEMELLGHDFFVFFNSDNGKVNVLYRRRDGGYGLLMPELT